MDFLVIGNGFIGKKRIEALLQLKEEGYPIDNIYLYDILIPEYLPKGIQIADENSFKKNAPDWVFIATPHYAAKDWVSVASTWGSKILLEKPMGRSYEEAQEIYGMLKYPEQLFLGFNYRFFYGVQDMIRDFNSGKFGEIISVNMMLGHGGKPSDINSWKLNPFEGSPDCLLDPGIHFLDLLNLMLPNKITPLYGKSWRGFWKTGIMEEINLLLKADEFPITLSTSVVKWKNTFSIQINGVDAIGRVEGRGGFYGEQTYGIRPRWGWLDNRIHADLHTDCADSFYVETRNLIDNPLDYNCTAQQGINTMKLYKECLKVIQ